MTTEFELAYDDFSAELDALTEMATGSGNLGAASFTPRARIAAGNGATLLLAALFEEHIRQQVRAVFFEKARTATDLSCFPDKIAAIVWKRSLESLARKPFDEIEADPRAVDQAIAATISFCLRKQVNTDVSEPLAHNDNNMRPTELGRLFNQVGVKGIISEACKSPIFYAFLGCDSQGKAILELESRIEEFFKRRNAVAHSIQIGSSSGPSEIVRDIELFRAFSKALYVAIQGAIS